MRGTPWLPLTDDEGRKLVGVVEALAFRVARLEGDWSTRPVLVAQATERALQFVEVVQLAERERPTSLDAWTEMRTEMGLLGQPEYAARWIGILGTHPDPNDPWHREAVTGWLADIVAELLGRETRFDSEQRKAAADE